MMNHLICFFKNIHGMDLSEPVIHQLRRVILDTVGCALGGYETPMGESMAAMGESFSQPGGAPVMGSAHDTSPFLAALINGSLANALDADDGHRTAKGHPAGVIIPAAMAATHISPVSGEIFLRAVLCGYEVGIRAGQAKNRGNTYHGSGYWAAFGACAAAGCILGISPEQQAHALGITEILAPNCQLMGWVGSRNIPMIKEGMGWAASTGLVAALMAKNGVTGTLTLFAEEENRALLATLGSDFEILRLYFKKYPCCRWTHAVLDILFNKVSEERIEHRNIRAVHIKTFHRASLLDNPRPETMEAAQYSLPFLVAVALMKGEVTPDTIARSLLDPAVSVLAEKVSISVDPEFESRFPERALAGVRLELEGGRRVYRAAETVPGDWDHPLTDVELRDKFDCLAQRRVTPEQAEQIFESTEALMSLPDISAYMGLLKRA